jgi:serine/threonine-protein kinase
MKLCPTCAEPFADEAGYCPFDGATLVRNADPLVGRTLAARYRLLRRVGTGGMGVVYLARHVMIERLSAIKILRQDLGMSPSHRERFLREARAVNRINHPNIVEINDFGEDAGLVYLVMEYVDGRSLHDALATGRLAWARGARIAMQIASALGRAHQLGIVHRDLKPENVLLATRAGEDYVKLGDFGIAKMLDAPALTLNEQRFGTPGYIAPEAIEGGEVTASSDLYALGVVLYNAVTGAMPFDARGAELLVATMREAPIKPSSRCEEIPAELEELILQLLARSPDDRPRDAHVVHEVLADILRRLGKTSRPPPSMPPPDEDETTGPATASETSSRSQLTAQLGAMPTAELAARWHGVLKELGGEIAAARPRGEHDPGVQRATHLAAEARSIVASLERAKVAVAEHQARVDRLETQGRSFRAMLGAAIDTLSRDQSRERAHYDAIAARRRRISEDASTPSIDHSSRESLVWERAALEAEEAKARQVDEDLGFQIAALQSRLAQQNEHLDVELRQASGELEGALAALRHMTGQLVRTIEEAAAAIGK